MSRFDMSELPIKHAWLIRMHYRMRTLSFAMMFVATGLHLRGEAVGVAAWLALAALFLVYPHVQYWRARRAADPVRLELQSLLVDSVLLGAYIAAVGFSQWLAFSVMLGTLSNNAANKGWRGVGQTIVALVGGALLWSAVAGFRFSPQTAWPATLFCIVGLSWYLLAMNELGYSRNRELRRAREALREREQELLTTNLDLRRSLEEIDQLQVQLREQAIHDPLTGLYNRGYLDSSLERELARCKREGEALSIAMIDVDHFKSYNDRYGHPAGDECLKRVAHALQASARRASDLVARYGGEEFSLILPDTDATAARQLAEAVRAAIEALAVPHEHSALGQVTISIGLATLASGAEMSCTSLVRAADEALYRAKRAGRNQVCVAPPAGSGDLSLAHFVQLVWHEAHRCANELINDQHQALFQRANRLLSAILAGSEAGELDLLVDALIHDVTRHFADEEAIITTAGLSGVAEHVAQHRALLDQAARMRESFRLGLLGIGDLYQFIAHDLIVRHMLGADKELLPELAPA